MSALAAAALLLRRLRGEAVIVVLLFLVVGVTSFLFAAAPRLLNRVTDDAVRYAVSSADPVQRDFWLFANGSIGPGNDPGVLAVTTYGQEREADLPGSISALIANQASGFTTVRFAVPQSIVVLSLRNQDGVPDGSQLVDGQWPVDRGMAMQSLKVGQRPSGGDEPAVFEIALSKEQADTIGAHVGDQFPLSLDSSDPLVPKTVFQIGPSVAQVVGIFEPTDPTANVWSGSGLLQPSYKQGADGITAIYATGYVAPEEYPRLAASHLPFHFDWHFPIDASKLNADTAATLDTDLQRINLNMPPTDSRFLKGTGSSVSLTNVSLGTGLPRILDGLAAQQARTESILSIAALGVLGLAGGATAMLAILLVRRRRGGLLLARGRGASGAFLIGTELLEAIVLAGGAAVIGLLLAIALVPARESPLSVTLAIVVAATATVLLVAATWPSARRPLIQLERDDPSVVRVPPRRLVIEASVVVIAVAAVILLRQRGLTLGGVGDAPTFDPLLAAVPLLIGIAAGIIAMRFYPLPVRALGRLAARRRDFVPVVGLRTVARHPATANLPLLVLMLTAAFGAFSSVIASSIDRGQVAASYLAVGADYRLEEVGIGGLPPTVQPLTIPGIQAAATGVVDSTASMVSGSNKTTVDLDIVDAPNYVTVTDGTAADPSWPTAFLTRPTATDVGTPGNPIPVVMSSQLPPAFANLHVGDTFTINVGKEPLIFKLAALQAAFPGHGNAASFAIVPLNWMDQALPDTSLVPTLMWVRGSDAAAAPLGDQISNAGEQVRIVSRQDAYNALHGAPLGSAVADFFTIALAVAVLYLAVTLVGAVIISAAGQTRDLAYLRTLGVSRRQSQALTAVEQTPPVAVTLIPGVLIGVGVALLVEPGLGLSDFVGAQGLPLYVDWPTLLLVVVALVVVVVAAIALGTWLASRTRLASALRIEEG